MVHSPETHPSTADQKKRAGILLLDDSLVEDVAKEFLSGSYKGVKVKLYGKDACHCASPASSGPIAQEGSSYSRFFGTQPLYAVEGSWKQDDLLLNDREAVPMCHDDDVSNDSHFPNQVDY